jgi:hypothetical protein
MKVSLVSVTPDAEKLMEYCARGRAGLSDSTLLKGKWSFAIRNHTPAGVVKMKISTEKKS